MSDRSDRLRSGCPVSYFLVLPLRLAACVGLAPTPLRRRRQTPAPIAGLFVSLVPSRLFEDAMLLERALEPLQRVFERLVIANLNLRQTYPSLLLPTSREVSG